MKLFLHLKASEKLVLMEAAFVITFWHVLVKTLPYNWYKKGLGKRVFKEPKTINSQPDQLKLIGWAIHASHKYLPWHPVCFAQALTGKTMLRFRGLKSVLLLGVAPGEDIDFLNLHSWLVCGEKIVTGGKESQAYKVIQIYH